MKEYEFKTTMVGGKCHAVAPDGSKTVPFPSTKAHNEREALRREFHIMELEMQFDKLIAWLMDAPLDSAEYEGKVAELHQLEVKMKQLVTLPDTALNCIAEKSINDIKYGRV